MKLLVINNISSGYGEGAIYDYMRSFVQDGDEIMMRSTDGATDLRIFLYDAENYDAVVVAGGDGTISAVTYLLADTGIPILPFPAGTANLLTTNLISPNEPHALATMTRNFKTMDFDLGEIALKDGTRFGFSNIAGAGYDAVIMQSATPNKKILGSMAYFTSAFANATPQFSQITLDIDGHRIDSSGVGILILNFAKLQFDLSIVHENKPRDGAFEVVVLNTKDAYGLIPALFASILDSAGEFPNRTDAIEMHHGSTITIYADPPLPIEYDGEVTNFMTPFAVRALPAAARFIVSDDCLKTFNLPAHQGIEN